MYAYVRISPSLPMQAFHAQRSASIRSCVQQLVPLLSRVAAQECAIKCAPDTPTTQTQTQTQDGSMGKNAYVETAVPREGNVHGQGRYLRLPPYASASHHGDGVVGGRFVAEGVLNATSVHERMRTVLETLRHGMRQMLALYKGPQQQQRQQQLQGGAEGGTKDAKALEGSKGVFWSSSAFIHHKQWVLANFDCPYPSTGT